MIDLPPGHPCHALAGLALPALAAAVLAGSIVPEAWQWPAALAGIAAVGAGMLFYRLRAWR